MFISGARNGGAQVHTSINTNVLLVLTQSKQRTLRVELAAEAHIFLHAQCNVSTHFPKTANSFFMEQEKQNQIFTYMNTLCLVFFNQMYFNL